MAQNNSARKILSFLHQAGEMKTAIRFRESQKMTGDSAADHSWRVALMTFVIAQELKLKINLEKALAMALIHDIVESLVGNTDYTAIAKGKLTEKQKHPCVLFFLKI